VIVRHSHDPQSSPRVPPAIPAIGGLLVVLTLMLIGVILLGVAIGSVSVPVPIVAKIILNHLMPNTVSVTWTPTQDQIVWQFRLPRVLLAVIVGAALSVSGTALQAMVRNPLADPYLFGVSSGASVAAVAVLTLGTAAIGGLSLSFAAFGGAMLTMVVVYALAQQSGRVIPTRLVLAGVSLGYVLSAMTSYLVLRSTTPYGGAAAVLTWLAGNLGGAKWQYLGLPSLAVLGSTGLLMLQFRSLNAVLAGDETAISESSSVSDTAVCAEFVDGGNSRCHEWSDWICRLDDTAYCPPVGWRGSSLCLANQCLVGRGVYGAG